LYLLGEQGIYKKVYTLMMLKVQFFRYKVFPERKFTQMEPFFIVVS